MGKETGPGLVSAFLAVRMLHTFTFKQNLHLDSQDERLDLPVCRSHLPLVQRRVAHRTGSGSPRSQLWHLCLHLGTGQPAALLPVPHPISVHTVQTNRGNPLPSNTFPLAHKETWWLLKIPRKKTPPHFESVIYFRCLIQ